MGATVTPARLHQAEKDFFITESVTELDTIQKGYVFTRSDIIQDTFVMPTATGTILLQPKPVNGIPSKGGSVAINERLMNLKEFLIYDEFDPDTWEVSWQYDQLTTELLNRKLPATFLNFLYSWYTQKGFEEVERMLHQGSTTYTTSVGTLGAPGVNYSIAHIDGIIKDALTNGAIQVASPVALTSANIISKLDAAIAAAPKRIKSSMKAKANLKIMMSVEDQEKLEIAAIALPNKGQDIYNSAQYKYRGYTLDTFAGMPENTFYFGHFDESTRGNICFGITSLKNMKFKIDELQNNAELWFYKLRCKLGVKIQRPSEFVIYTTKVLADFNA